ncbi:MAG: hypothetical protein MI924_21770 [Chloroflexales bacterium]|nr:hypothetical protein [Chloroflexales bacterium]
MPNRNSFDHAGAGYILVNNGRPAIGAVAPGGNGLAPFNLDWAAAHPWAAHGVAAAFGGPMVMVGDGETAPA